MNGAESEMRSSKLINGISIPLRTCAFDFCAEDASVVLLASRALKVTGETVGASSARLRHSISVGGFGPYELRVDGSLIGREPDRAAVFTAIMRHIEAGLLDDLGESDCAMHASSVSYRGRQVVFTGASGSGKTSMALVFSRYGSFLGDECGFLDMELGSLRYEPLPFQLKAANSALLERFDASRMLEVETPEHGKAFYVARSEVN